MKTTGMLTIGLVLSLVGTGCATKKYVAKTVAPVEQRVSGTESKNTEQDKTITKQGAQIEGIDRDLSQTKEKLTEAKSELVLFGFNKDTLSNEAKAQLGELGNQAKGTSRYVIEVQGFTDKRGPAP
jgi:outer membrane protein OmpA-like peptidoglycan-associated protein